MRTRRLPPLVVCDDCCKPVRTWSKLPLCPQCLKKRKRPSNRPINRDDIPY